MLILFPDPFENDDAGDEEARGGMGAAPRPNEGEPASNRNSISPNRRIWPGLSKASAVTCWLSMNVPFVALRSRMITSDPATMISQWWLDTDGSASSIALSLARPKAVVPSFKVKASPNCDPLCTINRKGVKPPPGLLSFMLLLWRDWRWGRWHGFFHSCRGSIILKPFIFHAASHWRLRSIFCSRCPDRFCVWRKGSNGIVLFPSADDPCRGGLGFPTRQLCFPFHLLARHSRSAH